MIEGLNFERLNMAKEQQLNLKTLQHFNNPTCTLLKYPYF